MQAHSSLCLTGWIPMSLRKLLRIIMVLVLQHAVGSLIRSPRVRAIVLGMGGVTCLKQSNADRVLQILQVHVIPDCSTNIKVPALRGTRWNVPNSHTACRNDAGAYALGCQNCEVGGTEWTSSVHDLSHCYGLLLVLTPGSQGKLPYIKQSEYSSGASVQNFPSCRVQGVCFPPQKMLCLWHWWLLVAKILLAVP